MLKELGIEAIIAEDARAAVANIACHGFVDILVVDLKMSPMGGEELSKLLLKDMPALKIVYMTGSSDQLADSLPYPVLNKPFDMEALAAALASGGNLSAVAGDVRLRVKMS
jgi:CheY-like chemotaxis protein